MEILVLRLSRVKHSHLVFNLKAGKVEHNSIISYQRQRGEIFKGGKYLNR